MHIVFSVLTAQKDMHDKVRSCMVIDFRTDLYTLRNSQISSIIVHGPRNALWMNMEFVLKRTLEYG